VVKIEDMATINPDSGNTKCRGDPWVARIRFSRRAGLYPRNSPLPWRFAGAAQRRKTAFLARAIHPRDPADFGGIYRYLC